MTKEEIAQSVEALEAATGWGHGKALQYVKRQLLARIAQPTPKDLVLTYQVSAYINQMPSLR